MRIAAAFLLLILNATAACAGEDTDVDKLLDFIAKPDTRPETKIAFPPIADWSSLRIRLERTACLGSCPVYKVEIRGDGTVRYEGNEWVAIPGKHRRRISGQAVRALFAQFQQAEFFWLLDDYITAVTDTSNDTVAISFDDHAKTVTDRWGVMSGLPVVVADLETQIDAVAGTKSWIEGDTDTVDLLKAEGWDFRVHADRNSALLVTVAEEGHAALLKQLMDEGVSPRNTFGCAAMQAAALGGHIDMVELLIAAGAPVDAPQYEKGKRYYPRCTVLGAAAEAENPKIVERILGLHPDFDAQDGSGRTALMRAVQGYADNRDDQLAVLDRLIAAGADVNLRDSWGKSALMRSFYDTDMAAMLLEAGADPSLKDKDGKSPWNWLVDASKTSSRLERWMAAHPQK